MPTQQPLDRVRELRHADRTPREIPREAEDAAERGSAAHQIGRRRRTADPGGCADRVLDQSGLVVQRPGIGAAGLAGVWPVGTNRALGLVTVLVARDRGGPTAGVCFYLVDTWCLG